MIVSEHTIIEDALHSSQNVRFVIDTSADFEQLKSIELSKYQKGIVFCDEALRDTWWPIIHPALSSVDISRVKWLSAREETKSVAGYVKLVDHLAEMRCSRDDVIIVVGGGTILDAVAYLASTYMRGIDLMMIPTTLVGQADASTAGKTCINTDYAKNVLGTLYLPFIVYNNVNILNSVSPYHMRQGFSEIFKYGLLGSRELLKLIEEYSISPDNHIMGEILKKTIDVRLKIRKKDPLASNLGHTFGHALEKISSFRVNHGDAISAGIVIALEFSAMHDIISNETKDDIVEMMVRLGLNRCISNDIEPRRLVELMLTDKKSSNTEVRLVLIDDISIPYEFEGRPFYPVDPSILMEFLERFMKDGRYIRKAHWEALFKNELQ